MRVATWNVNSIRARVDRVTDWLARADVDVLAMQETKCSDDKFPAMPFVELGYEVAYHGLNQWNGVAIASRVGLENVQLGFDNQPAWERPPRLAPWPRRVAGCAYGASTCPMGAQLIRRITPTNSNGSRRCGTTPRNGWPTIHRHKSH